MDNNESNFNNTSDQKSTHNLQQFLKHLSHEITTPINSIVSFAQNLSKLEKIDQREKSEYYAHIKDSSSSLIKIIENLRTYCVISSHGTPNQDIIFCLSDLLRQTIEVLSVQIASKQINVSTYISEDFPHHLRGDQHKFKQILINLLDNAIKYSLVNSHISIYLKSRTLKKSEMTKDDLNHIHVSICDDGQGIAQDKMQNIMVFPFEREGSDPISPDGMGLGLPIANSLIQEMGGQLALDSEVEIGTTASFTIYLKSVKSAFSSNSAPYLHNNVLDYKDLNILIAEDDKNNQILMKELFEQLGCEFYLVTDGYEAINELLRKPYDLILMDISMPKLNGLEAAKQIRSLNITTPIIGLSGYSQGGVEETVRKSGFNDFLLKPFKMEHLKKLIIDHTLQSKTIH